jgi:hypothetical protein
MQACTRCIGAELCWAWIVAVQVLASAFLVHGPLYSHHGFCVQPLIPRAGLHRFDCVCVPICRAGAGKCAVMDGPLYPHQGGLAFVSRPSKVHLLLMDQVEGVWLQDLSAQLPGYAGVGPCLVLRGRQPACGLLPACYLTDNPHVAIPLRQMSKVGAVCVFGL